MSVPGLDILVPFPYHPSLLFFAPLALLPSVNLLWHGSLFDLSVRSSNAALGRHGCHATLSLLASVIVGRLCDVLSCSEDSLGSSPASMAAGGLLAAWS